VAAMTRSCVGIVEQCEPALHPIDDPRRACDGHVERLGEAAHGHRPLGVEEDQHVEVHEAERPEMPPPEHGDELARIPGAELRGDFLPVLQLVVGEYVGDFDRPPLARGLTTGTEPESHARFAKPRSEPLRPVVRAAKPHQL